MEDDFETELFLEAKDSQDVIVTVGVMMDGAFSVEDVGESFKGEIAFEGFLGISFGALYLVGLCVEEFLAHEGRRFSTSAGEGTGFADGIGAVSHLDPSGERAVGALDGEVFHGVASAEFEVDRLAGKEMAGAGHEVDGGDATGAGFIDGGVTDVDGIHNTDFGLDGR